MSLRDTLTWGIRLTGARALGEDPPAEELDVALTAFQMMTDALVALGGPLTDVAVTADYTAGENERVSDISGSSVTVTLPTTITDAKTGQDRAPRNGAVVEVCGTAPAVYVYCAQLAAWMNTTGLTENSTQPFGPEHEEGLRAMLAVRIAPALQQPDPKQWVVAMAEQGRRALRQRLRQTPKVTTDPLLLNVFQRNGCTL